MAVTSGFFNSLYGDRKYTAEQFSAIFDGVINDGVFSNIGTAFRVSAATDNMISIGIGRAWFNGIWINNDAILPMTCNDPEVLLDRIDAVVIEINRSEAVRAGRIIFVKGTASGTPVNPTLTHDEGVDQYPLAYIRRKAGVSEVVQADITNCIGTSECPYVTGILETQNIDSIVAQWESEFNIWFDGLQTELDGDVAANLASQIIELNSRFNELAETRTITVELEDSTGDTIEDSAGAAIYGSTVLESEGSGTIVVEQDREDPNIGRIKINDEYEDVMKTVPVGFTVDKIGSGTISGVENVSYSMYRNGNITCGNWMIFLNSVDNDSYYNRTYVHLFAFNFKTHEMKTLWNAGGRTSSGKYYRRAGNYLTYLGPNKFAVRIFYGNSNPVTVENTTGWYVYDVTDSDIIQNNDESIIKSKYTSSSLDNNLFRQNANQYPRLVAIKDGKAYFVENGYVGNTLQRLVFTYSGTGSVSTTNEFTGYSSPSYVVLDSENILVRVQPSYQADYRYTKYNIVTNTKTSLPNITNTSRYVITAILEKHIVFTSSSDWTVKIYNLETNTMKDISLGTFNTNSNLRIPSAIKDNKLYFCGFFNYVPRICAIDLDTLMVVSETNLRFVEKEAYAYRHDINYLEININPQPESFVSYPRPEFREPNAAFSWAGENLKNSGRFVSNNVGINDQDDFFAFILDIDEQIIFNDLIKDLNRTNMHAFIDDDTILFTNASSLASGYVYNVSGIVRKLLPLYTTKTDLGGEED